MSEEAEKLESEDASEEADESTITESDDDEKSVEGEEQEAADIEEAEIVLSGEEGSQPSDKNLGIRKRINKLNAKVAAAKEGQTEAAAALEIERERNRLLQLALEQRGDETPEVPDPNEYDEGVADPKYVAALQAHIAKGVQEEIKKSQPRETAPSRAPDLEAKQMRHYERADTLKVRDYDDAEDKAIGILGQDIANQMIASTEKSPEILYYLGKNPGKAEEIKELIASDPIRGVLEIGKLEARLTVKPKANSKPAPDPDTELEGGTSPKPNMSDYERKLDRLRAKAQETGDIGPVLAFKREHAARAN